MKMNFSLGILISAAALLCAGCATKPAHPDWVEGDTAQYANSQYLLGRGEAATQEEAKDRARADIAKSFSVAVTVDSEDVRGYTSNTAEFAAGKYKAESTIRITTSTGQIISGIQIAEIWQDPASKSHHVLAILPREQATASLSRQIRELDGATRNTLEQSQGNDDLLLKTAATSKALALQLEREGLNRALQVVDLSGRGVEPKYSSARLRVEQDELLGRLRVASKVLQGSVAGLGNVVEGALSKAGFKLDSGEKPVFLLKTSLVLSDMGLKDGWYWQRGSLEISMSEVASGRVRGTQRWPIKSAATDRAGSVRRALDDADAILRKELGKAIVGMAISQ